MAVIDIMVVMIRMQISLSEEQAERLRRAAEIRRISMAALVRESIDRAVAADAALGTRGRALAAVGRYRSGGADTSRSHDAVLAETFAE
jgi:hypothetical protein